MRNAKPGNEWLNPKTGEVLTEPGQKITGTLAAQMAGRGRESDRHAGR
jgi:hypothetical protein